MEYKDYISDYIKSEHVLDLDNYVQHKHSTRLAHSLTVSYWAYNVAKALHMDVESVAVGGLLHDFYFYNGQIKQHNLLHPLIALNNATAEFELNEVEKDIIKSHMFGVNLIRPHYFESVLVNIIDDVVACYDFVRPVYSLKLEHKFIY